MALIAISLALIAPCTTVSDCSTHPVTSPTRCIRLRENRDFARAQQCNKDLSDIMLEKQRQQCCRRCLGDNCEEKCNGKAR